GGNSRRQRARRSQYRIGRQAWAFGRPGFGHQTLPPRGLSAGAGASRGPANGGWGGGAGWAAQALPFLRRVSQPLRAAAERCSAEPDLWARPPRDEAEWLSFLPRPEPDLLPPPDSLLTVAQARALAIFSEAPRSS